VPIRVRGAPVRVPAGGLDAPLAVPALHVHVAEKAPWLEVTGRAPRFAERPPGDPLPELSG
jgi:hypothetical protein